MGFFDDKLGPVQKAEPVQPVAPGSWWQTPTQQQRQVENVQLQQVVNNQAPQANTEYAPQSSGFVKTRVSNEVEDTCPRCGSYDYIKIAAEPAAGSVYRLPGSSARCMACNYPGIDTSEGVIGGPGGFVPTGDAAANTLKVRERGGKNRNSFAGFNESSQAADSHVVRIM